MNKFDRLIKYLPMLEENDIGAWIFDRRNDGTPEHPITMPFVKYSETVYNFIDDIIEFADKNKEYGLTHYRDILMSNGIEWGDRPMREADVSSADAKCILALLVAAVRAERFCEGLLLSFFKDGSIKKWLERLKELGSEVK